MGIIKELIYLKKQGYKISRLVYLFITDKYYRVIILYGKTEDYIGA